MVPKSTKSPALACFFHLQRLLETRRQKVIQKLENRAVPKVNIWCSVHAERHFLACLLDTRKLAKDSPEPPVGTLNAHVMDKKL